LNKIKVLVTILALSSTLTPLAAIETQLNLQGGTAILNNYNNGLALGGKLSWVTKQGIGLSGSAQYITASSALGSGDIKLIPVQVGISYYLMPERQITPYFLGYAAYNLINDGGINSTKTSFGAKAGVHFKIGPENFLFLEADKNTLEHGSSDLNLITYSLGVGLKFGDVKKQKHIKKQPKRAPNRRRNKRRRLRQSF
jgi:hypothetical protein